MELAEGRYFHPNSRLTAVRVICAKEKLEDKDFLDRLKRLRSRGFSFRMFELHDLAELEY